MSRPQLTIQVAQATDLTAVARLEAAAFDEPWPVAVLEPVLSDAHHFAWLCRLEEQLVGYALFRGLAPEAELLRLAVAPERRRQGIARSLLIVGHAAVGALGVETVFLEVRETNAAARGLYESLGYGVVGRRLHYYKDGTGALVYRLRLSTKPAKRK